MKITGLTEKTTLTDNDVFVVDDGSETQKTKYKTIKDSILSDELCYKVDLDDGTWAYDDSRNVYYKNITYSEVISISAYNKIEVSLYNEGDSPGEYLHSYLYKNLMTASPIAQSYSNMTNICNYGNIYLYAYYHSSVPFVVVGNFLNILYGTTLDGFPSEGFYLIATLVPVFNPEN